MIQQIFSEGYPFKKPRNLVQGEFKELLMSPAHPYPLFFFLNFLFNAVSSSSI